MDPFLTRLFQMQTDPGAGGDGGTGAPAPEPPAAPAADPGPAAIDPAAAPAAAAPAAAAPSYDDPAFIAAVDQRSAEMFEHRWNALIASGQAPQPAAPAAAQVDLNELLSPLSETFGENLARFLADRDKFLLDGVSERLQPVLSREEQAQVAQGQQRMDELITQGWNSQTDGELKPAAKAAIKDLAPSYLPEFEQRYGAGPMAAEAALAKASATIRALNADARGAGGQANVDGLAAVAAAAGEPGTGGGAISVPPPAASPREVFNRYFALNGTARS